MSGKYEISAADSGEVYEYIKGDEWQGLRALLLRRGFSVNCLISSNPDNYPHSLLQAASQLGSLDVIEGLISDGAELECSKHYGTPLNCAVAFDQFSAAELLLKLGANPNAIGPSEVDGDAKWTPLLRATFRRNRPLVELLLQKGADPRTVSRRSASVLTCAAHNQDVELVKKFSAIGASPVGSALLCAIDKENEEILGFLLAAGCDPNYVAGASELALCEKGDTPLSLAMTRYMTWNTMTSLRTAMEAEGRVFPQVDFTKMIQMLLQAGADPNKQVGNRTPLSIAACAGLVEVSHLLLDFGADPTGKSFSSFVDGVRQKGTRSAFYETALHTALKGGYKQIVRALLEAGANPSDVDHSGVSALEWVQKSNNPELIALFDQMYG
ncbi:MAG: hypothetical protein H0X66_04800 [Verrucomicrobia bacterium]|nr:hypothetical protein [Verrucomicrobiota bacterium]